MNDKIMQMLINLSSKKKEEDVYKYLHEQYHDVLFRFAFAYVKSRETAEEIVADVLYKLWENRHNLSQIQNLRLYLFTAVRNRCITYLNKQRKEKEIFSTFHEQHQQTNDVDPEELMITSELFRRIQNEVEKLPPRCKLIYKMIREEGLRNKDVAKELGISINTIDVQLALALKRIKNAIQ